MTPMTRSARIEQPIKSRQRVSEHGEVLTPAWVVEDMLNLVKNESERIEARVLEPACGSGNFLVPLLTRKLATVHSRYGKSDFERRHQALLALMCIYGVELLADNVKECRANLLATFVGFLPIGRDDFWRRAAEKVLEANILQGDALAMVNRAAEPLEFAEWGYLGRGRFQRRDFRYDSLAQRSAFEGARSERPEMHVAFMPVRSYLPMTVEEIAG